MNANVEPLQIGTVLFPGFELLDVYGPLEMLGLLRERASITMLAEKRGEVPSYQGPKAVADVSLAEASGLDVLLVPGGWGTRKEVQNLPFLDLLRARAQEARFVASVCTGSALLARTGILDGKRATSNKLAFDWVTTQGPTGEMKEFFRATAILAAAANSEAVATLQGSSAIHFSTLVPGILFPLGILGLALTLLVSKRAAPSVCLALAVGALLFPVGHAANITGARFTSDAMLIVACSLLAMKAPREDKPQN